MARSLRRIRLVMIAAAAGWSPTGANAICIPLIGGWECNFKDEDTQLFWYQPGIKFISEENTDTLINDAWSAIELYRSTTKTLGDEAIRPSIAEMSASVDAAIASAIVDLAATAQNDPFDLKPLYTDAICNAYWEPRHDRTCATTPELVLDAERLLRLNEVRAALRELEADPFLFLGEEWGDIAADVQTIRAEFKRLETIGPNLDPDTIAAEVGRRFEGVDEVLGGPKTTLEEWHAARRETSATLHSTMADTYASAREMAAQAAADAEEIQTLQTMSRNSVGRMQQMELGNMTDMLANQEWLKIREVVMHRGNLIGLDMASEMEEDAMQRAEGERMWRPIEGVETVLGNEVGANLP